MDSIYIGDVVLYSILYKNTTLLYDNNMSWFKLCDINHRSIYEFHEYFIINHFNTLADGIVIYDYCRAILASHRINLKKID